jgi:hypothetical protein
LALAALIVIGRLWFHYSWPIIYWGRVVDQDGKPIRGAIVQTGIGRSSSYKTTDSDGRFRVRGRPRSHLFLSVSANGYYLFPDSGSGAGYPEQRSALSHSRPDTFRLKKAGEVQQLEGYRVVLKLSNHDEPSGFDLIAHSPAKPGNIQFHLKAEPPPGSNKNRFDWTAKITMPGGGLIPGAKRLDFIAPADGYASEYTKSMSAEERDFQGGFKERFFIKTAPPARFGVLEVDVSPYAGRGGAINLQYRINPTGSRNLEEPPFQEIPYLETVQREQRR